MTTFTEERRQPGWRAWLPFLLPCQKRQLEGFPQRRETLHASLQNLLDKQEMGMTLAATSAPEKSRPRLSLLSMELSAHLLREIILKKGSQHIVETVKNIVEVKVGWNLMHLQEFFQCLALQFIIERNVMALLTLGGYFFALWCLKAWQKDVPPKDESNEDAHDSSSPSLEAS